MDGVCFRHDCNKQIYSIGLAIPALHISCDYAVMLIIHELCHMFYNDESNRAFFRHMDDLLDRYNRATNSNVINDYSETSLKYDSAGRVGRLRRYTTKE